MKIEVGKKYELNNGEVHECTHMRKSDPIYVDDFGYGPFVINDILYHQDGRFADADADHEYSVKREVLTVQSGKYYRTRDGRKVGPMVQWSIDANHPFEVTNEDGTDLGRLLWSESGRVMQQHVQNDECSDLDLIAEWTEHEAGTLAELDVKPGDVVECVKDGLRPKIIDGEEGVSFSYIGGDGISIDLATEQYRIISRASNTPKTWGEMTDAERVEDLEQLFNKCVKGLVTEEYCNGYMEAIDHMMSRIKPEPKRETVTLWWEQGCVAGRQYYDEATHRITFTTTNGKPDLDSIKMEEV